MRMTMAKKDKQLGFSFFELIVAIFLITILVAVVILATQGFFGKAQERAWETDMHVINTAVDSYMIQSFKVPTADGKLPLSGEYALIDFYASFIHYYIANVPIIICVRRHIVIFFI